MRTEGWRLTHILKDRDSLIMQYSKVMIDLVFQIRKSAPTSLKSRIKLTNPQLPATLTDIYGVVDDQALKILIYEFLDHAGSQWVQRLSQNHHQPPVLEDTLYPEVHKPTPAKKAESRASGADFKSEKASREKVVIYRGHRMVVPA